MADRYWVGGAGNWNDTAKWSTSSGGAGGASVPGAADNAIFDINSDTGTNFTATVNASFTIANLTFTSVDRLITLGTAGNLTVTGATTISANAPASPPTTGMLVSGNASLGAITLNSGLLNIDGNTVTAVTFSSGANDIRTFDFGTNGNINITGNNTTVWNFVLIGTPVVSGTGAINLTYSGGVGTRSVNNFTLSGNPNVNVTAGTDSVQIAVNIGSLNFTGFSGTWVNISSLTINGSLTVSTGMTVGSGTNGVAIGATGTITSNGKTLDFPLTISAPSSTVSLGDNLNLGLKTLSVIRGTFTTTASNFSITARALTSDTSNTRSILLNGSTVTVGALAAGISFSFGSTLTFDAGTSSIIVTHPDGAISSNVNTIFYNVTFSSSSTGTRTITGNLTFNNLTLTASATGLSKLYLSGNQTINGTLTCSGSSPTQRAYLFTPTLGTQHTITAAAISADDCDFRDIILAGAAAGAAPTRAGDLGNNSGIVFPAPKTVYWNLAGTQTWNSTGWATTPSGTPAVNNFPLAQDTAVFTDIGAATSVSTSPIFNLGSIDASSRTSPLTLDHSSTIEIYGNYSLGPGVTFTGFGLRFSSFGTQTFTSSGVTLSGGITVNKPAGTIFQLGDDFSTAPSSITTFRLNSGIFNTQNYNFTSSSFISDGTATRTITMGSGLWTLNGTGTIWNVSATNLTFNKNTANILLSSSSGLSRSFIGGGLVYNKLTIGGVTTSTTTISGNNTFSELASTNPLSHTVTFSGNQTVQNWTITGTPGNVVTLNSDTPGTGRTITKSGGGFLAGIDYLNVRDIVGSPQSDTWYIGFNSVYNSTGPNVAQFLFLTQRINNVVFVLTSTTPSTWTVPADWNNANNSIHLIGGGGGGAGRRSLSISGINYRAAGGGGGGGGYTRLNNQTLGVGSSIPYQAGTGGNPGVSGSDGVAGGTTSWNSGAATAGGGGGGQATTTPSSTGGVAGVGSTFNGGAGGPGAFGTTSSAGYGGGGGGGAGGPNGNGGNGGDGFGPTTSSLNINGGGGGGNGGGGNGGSGGVSSAGIGGNNSLGVGGGASNSSGWLGGGAGGSNGIGTKIAGYGIEIFGAGSGGGAGGSGNGDVNNFPGRYGGGGSGASVPLAGTATPGSSGVQGAIIITYVPGGAAGNMFLMFN